MSGQRKLPIAEATVLVSIVKFDYNKPMKNYKIFNHTADIGCEIFGKTRKELFAASVAAMFGLILEHRGNQKGETSAAFHVPTEEKEVVITGSDLEDLLINFLREVLYLFNGEHWVITGCHPSELSRKKIVAQLTCEHYYPRTHRIKMEIKAVTYHALSIKRMNKGWRARVIFDV